MHKKKLPGEHLKLRRPPDAQKEALCLLPDRKNEAIEILQENHRLDVFWNP